METKISKIQFRQDTQANWESSSAIPALGEPCYDISNGVFKIGDGVHSFRDLPSQTIPEGMQSIQEPVADGNKYARTRRAGQTNGEWYKLPDEDNRKTLSDILASPYNTEINMGYNIITTTGEKAVYGMRCRTSINATVNELVETNIKSGLTNLISFNGVISSDGHHDYMIPANTTKFTANVMLDEENGMLKVISRSDESRVQAELDCYFLYTKE